MTTSTRTTDANVLLAVVAFVEARMNAEDFESALYEDPSFEEVLSEDPDLPRDTYIGSSTYQFVLEQDYRDPGGVLNAQGALAEFLERRGVDHTRSDDAADEYDALLLAQPSWLDLDTKYIKEQYLDHADGRTGKRLTEWLRKRLLDDFRCAAKPPRWLQNPAWSIGDKGPMVFLGQVTVKDYFHDTAAVYVFHDPATDERVTVLQVM